MWFQSNQPIGEKHSDGPAKSILNCEWKVHKETM